MKILASDFDNTLYIEQEEIIKRNIQAINNFLLKGNLFCIITGRNYTNIKKLLNEYHIPYSYLICEDGAKIFNNMDYCINTQKIASQTVKTIQTILEENQIPYFLDDGYNETKNIEDCVKIAGIYKHKEQAIQVERQIKENTNVYVYLSKDHINITENSVNKCNALKTLLAMENFSNPDLYVAGDEINDLEMLQEFQGAIMTNHNPKLNKLGKKEYDYLYQYIEELSQK